MPKCECKSLLTECDLCVERREIALMFRAILLRMKLGIKYNGEFNVWREAGDLQDRVLLPTHWIELCYYNDGADFVDIYGEEKVA